MQKHWQHCLCANWCVKSFSPLNKVFYKSYKTAWLVCPDHNLHWCHRSFYQVIIHSKQVPHSCLHVPRNHTFIPMQTNTVQLIESQRTNSPVTPLSSHFDSNASYDTTSSDIVSKDDFILMLLASSISINFTNYNVKFRHFLESKQLNEGLGSKRIVTCAFSMDRNSNNISMSDHEANYHFKAAMFRCSLSSTL